MGFDLICPLVAHVGDPTEAISTNSAAKNEYWDCVSTLIGYGLITDSDLSQQRLLDCEGLGDVYDTGGNPSLEHPDAGFRGSWMTYSNTCLTGVPFRAVITTWGDLLFQNEAAFQQIVENDTGCNGTDLASLIIRPPDLELTRDEVNTLLVNPELIEPIQRFLDNKEGVEKEQILQIVHVLLETIPHQTNVTPELIDQIILFWEEHYSILTNEDPTEDIITFLKLKQVDDDYKFERFEELYELLEENPDALVEDCQEELGIDYWSDLASFAIPNSCQNRIDGLGWENQDILAGNSKTGNLDRHSVSITQLPDLNGDGIRSKQELYDFIRLNFPVFANGGTTVELNSFPDYSVVWDLNFFQTDYVLWASPNPVTTVMNIDVSPESVTDFWGITDDATVICSSFDNECCWVFSTVTTGQFTFPYDGSHPVSGNRQFGIETLADEYQFYTKAADRGKLSSLLKPGAWMTGNDMSKIFYAITDATWNNLTQKVASFINRRGGIAVQNTPITIRPNWNEVMNPLRSNAPITAIPCE